MGDYASAVANLDRHAEADALWTQLIATRARVFGPDDRRTLLAMSIRSVNLDMWGKEHHQEAEALAKETVARQRRALGPEHFDTLYTAGNLGHGGPAQYNTIYTHFKLISLLCDDHRSPEGSTSSTSWSRSRAIRSLENTRW